MINFKTMNNMKAILSVIPESTISQSEKDEFFKSMVVYDEFVEHVKARHNVDAETVRQMMSIVIDNAKDRVPDIDLDKAISFTKPAEFFVYAITTCCVPVMVEFAAKEEFGKLKELEATFTVMIKVAIIVSDKL